MICIMSDTTTTNDGGEPNEEQIWEAVKEKKDMSMDGYEHYPIGTKWDTVHEETDGFTFYTSDVETVEIVGHTGGYYDLEML